MNKEKNDCYTILNPINLLDKNDFNCEYYITFSIKKMPLRCKNYVIIGTLKSYQEKSK